MAEVARAERIAAALEQWGIARQAPGTFGVAAAFARVRAGDELARLLREAEPGPTAPVVSGEDEKLLEQADKDAAYLHSRNWNDMGFTVRHLATRLRAALADVARLTAVCRGTYDEADRFMNERDGALAAVEAAWAEESRLQLVIDSACNALTDSICVSGNDAATNLRWVGKLRREAVLARAATRETEKHGEASAALSAADRASLIDVVQKFATLYGASEDHEANMKRAESVVDTWLCVRAAYLAKQAAKEEE